MSDRALEMVMSGLDIRTWTRTGIAMITAASVTFATGIVINVTIEIPVPRLLSRAGLPATVLTIPALPALRLSS